MCPARGDCPGPEPGVYYPHEARPCPAGQRPRRLALPLKGYLRLHEANLRAERKTPKTIAVYGWLLGKFVQWFTTEHGRAPVLGDSTGAAVRFFLMLDTGLRLFEVIHLKDDHVDLDEGVLRVMGKGRKERSIPFGHTAEKVLRRCVIFFRPDPATPNCDEFFLPPDGYPLTQKAFYMVFVRARQRTAIARLHPHLLRHTYGIRAQENDMSTMTLPHYLGHSSSKVTERYVPAAQSEKLERARSYSPVDQLRLRVKPGGPRKRGRRPSVLSDQGTPDLLRRVI